MIPGTRGGPARPLRAAAALSLCVGAAAAVCLSTPASAGTTGAAVPSSAGAAATAAPTSAAPTSAGTSWARAWSWRPGSTGLPTGCAPYTGRTSAGLRWSPAQATVADGRLRLATATATAGDGTRATGSGVGCTGRAQRYGRVEVRARMPRGSGLVGRIALWPSTESRGSDWSGLTVTSGDSSPAYATNGCGNEAFGAAVPARLTGAFHTYVISWAPDSFSVAVDGRELYRDKESFGGARWLGISLAATGSTPSKAQLLVERVTVYRWTGPTRTRKATTPEPSSSASNAEDVPATWQGEAARGAAGLGAVAGGVTGSGSTTPSGAGGSTAGGPAAAVRTELATNGGRGALVAALEDTRLGTPWLVGGGCVAVGVLVGVVRAALAARRRPLVPR